MSSRNFYKIIPKNVKQIHSAFKKEGKKLYIVGGAVRDFILNRKPKDYDLATDAKPDEVLAIAKKYGFNSSEVGKAFGVVIVNGEEIATFRKDIGKGRRPDSVDYTDIKGDVKRRDLTINALFYDIERGEIVDLVGGIKDLENKSIRTVGKAEERFEEDPLRKLRVLRFAGRIGGKIEPATEEALEGNPDISGVSPERIRDEFVKAIKTSKSTRWYLNKAHDLKILQQILPRIQYSTDFIDENDYILVISWLLRKKDPQNVYKYLKKLKYSHEESYDIKFLLHLSHFDPKNVFRLKKLQENSSLSDKQLLKWGKMVNIDLKKFIRFELSVKGDDVMKMGFKGREIGKQIEKMEKEKYLNENKVKGGLADGMSVNDIAKHHKVPVDKIVKQLKMGIKVEMEHVNDPKASAEIALDHLYEDPDYYTKLKTIEPQHEASYTGNLGFEEMMKFYDQASSKEIKTLEKLIDRGRESLAWKLVQKVTGMKLKGKEFEQVSHLSEATIANTLGSGNNSARWTAPSQKRKMKVEQLSGYVQVDFPEADELDISNEEFGWEQISKSKKYNNKRTVVRNNEGKLVFEGTVAELKHVMRMDGMNELLREGGAYGHMNHPFDTDINLTFGQLKDIVDRALEGKLEMTTEKLDGQALAISWKHGRLIAARNKGHLKNKGEAALDINGVADKFQGRGEIEKAYNYAMRDLSKAIEKLSDAQREKIFKEGACFMNLEVIYPPSSNVIPYGAPFLVFHGTMEYDDDGNAIGENKEAARILAGMIKQVEEEVQDTYTISGPPVVELPKEQDLSRKKAEYKQKIKSLQDEFKLRDNDGVAEYHQAWWKQWVENNAPKELSNRVLMGIVGRWAFEDRSFRLNGKTIEDEEVLAWAKKHDKSKLIKSTRKDNLMKFENIFLGLGAEVLNFTKSALVVSPDKATRKIKDDIEKAIKDVRKKGSEKQIDKLELELKRLNAIGGIENIVPIEGVVFQYKAKDTVYTLKLTGSFAPSNQLLGIFFGS